MRTEMTFAAGTKARCNRNCAEPSPLPKAIRGIRENSNAYRLQKFCILDCGHMDCHWVFLSDNPALKEAR
jgi:hypothetical protein